MLPLQIVGMNLSLYTQLPSGTALRHRKEMRMNVLHDHIKSEFLNTVLIVKGILFQIVIFNFIGQVRDKV